MPTGLNDSEIRSALSSTDTMSDSEDSNAQGNASFNSLQNQFMVCKIRLEKEQKRFMTLAASVLASPREAEYARFNELDGLLEATYAEMERLITQLRPHLADGNPNQKETLKDITQQLANYRTEAMEKMGRDVIAKMGSVRATNQETEAPQPHPAPYNTTKVQPQKELEPVNKFEVQLSPQEFEEWKQQALNYAELSNFAACAGKAQVQFFTRLVTAEAKARLDLERCSSFQECIEAAERVHKAEFNMPRMRAIYFAYVWDQKNQTVHQFVEKKRYLAKKAKLQEMTDDEHVRQHVLERLSDQDRALLSSQKQDIDLDGILAHFRNREEWNTIAKERKERNKACWTTEGQGRGRGRGQDRGRGRRGRGHNTGARGCEGGSASRSPSLKRGHIRLPQDVCTKCGGKNHRWSSCTKTNLVCAFCSKKGHVEAVCLID